MIDIRYRQEKVNILIYIIPGVMMAAGVVFTIVSMLGAGMGVSVIVPVIFIAVGAAILLIGLRQAKKTANEMKEIREKGRELFGEIREIEEHVSYTSDGDGGTDREYSYNFIVNYTDPDTLQPVTAESIPTFQKYELKSPECQIRVYNGIVLVEKAYVEAKKSKAIIPVILFFVAAAVYMIGKSQGWF